MKNTCPVRNLTLHTVAGNDRAAIVRYQCRDDTYCWDLLSMTVGLVLVKALAETMREWREAEGL